MPPGTGFEPLTSFVRTVTDVTGADEVAARAQIFVPTGYPQKITVTPGVVMSYPTKVDYAPDIEVADKKIRSLNALANSGKLAVLNISIEPGSGKTLFLPFKFVGSKCLVVLPTVFDAWSAHTANAAASNILLSGYASNYSSSVTYTDSYHAAYLMSTGKIVAYNMVFVDESHSQEGVTNFMASVARPGIVFVRMTASPPTVNSRPKKSFPVMEERDVPNISNLTAAAAYITGRPEHRVLVLAPSPEVADSLSALVPRSRTLTMLSPMDQLHTLMSEQSESAVIITDYVCGKGVNLNADCAVDFGLIDTPAGVRNITIPEQLQRKARVGRSKTGVYCSAYTASARQVTDNYSVFRSNLFKIVNGLVPAECTFEHVSVDRALQLLTSMSEPALVPEPSGEIPLPCPVTPVLEEDSSESGATVETLADDHRDKFFADLLVTDEREPDLPGEREFTTPSWYAYYMERENHPASYVADLIHDHRSITVRGILIDNEFVIKQAPNRLLSDGSVSSADRYRLAYSNTKVLEGPALPPSSPAQLQHSVWAKERSGRGSISGSTSFAASKYTPGELPAVTQADSLGVKYGSAGHSLSAYKSTPPRSPFVGLARSGTKGGSADLPFDSEHLGGPLAILRGSKVSSRSRGVGYKAASVCGGYLVTTGVVLATGSDLHSGLVPLHQDARRALHENTGERTAVDATHYLTWVVAHPLSGVNVADQIRHIKAAGAWSVPPTSVVPVINLEVEYHPSWVQVVTNRIRDKSPLPPIVPRVGWFDKGNKRRPTSDDTLDSALDACDYPTYSSHEQQLVHRAWNILAIRSSVVGRAKQDVFVDAQALLGYMSGADRLVDL